jgi:alkylhydroperoxidase/carboxymuconolactone decarboxylase family protein YurZ
MSRHDLRKRGLEVRAALALDQAAGPEPVPGFDDFMTEAAYGGIWDRPHLTHQDRMLCTLGILSFLGQNDHLERMLGSALDLGIPARSILEAFMQSGLYAGYITTEASAAVAHRVFARRGVDLPPEPERNDDNETLDERGRELMHSLHRDRATKGYGAGDNPITSRLYTTAIRYGYGELWFRPGLDHRQRMLIAISSFTAIPLESQLRKFSQSALNIGLSKDEVIEAVIQTAPYSGFPRALNGLGILSEVF